MLTNLFNLFAKRRKIIVAANTAEAPIVAFNAVAGSGDAVVVEANAEKRTARLFVPFGVYGPIQASDRRDGKIKPTMQEFDLEAANAIIAGLSTLRGKLATRFRMIPIYEGHPDVREMANVYTDRSAKGWIIGANVGEIETGDGKKPGLFFDAEMTRSGMQLIQDDEFAFHSPRWGMAPMTAANDKLQRARPVQILSAGLTNTPFIPGSLAVANDDMAVAQEAATSIDVPTLATLLGLEPASPLSKVLAEIARLFEIATQLAKGSRLVNEAEWRASETAAGQLVQANTELAAARAAAETEKALALAATARVQELEGRIVAANDQLTGAQTAATETAARIEAANTATVQAREEAARTAAALEAANTALVASRKAHAGLIVATAIEEGRMFQADRDARIAELVAANCDAAACDRIANAPVIVKVRSEIGNLGGRRIGAAVSASLLERARQQAEQTGGDVTEIYIRLKGAA